jgi:hypothetical protein
MRARLRKLAFGACCALCVLLLAAWANSYRKNDFVRWSSRDRLVGASATRGSVSVRHVWIEGRADVVRFDEPGFRHRSLPPAPMTPAVVAKNCDIYWAFGPFSFLRGRTNANGGNVAPPTCWVCAYELIVPFWFVVGVTTAIAICAYRWIQRLPPPGHCAKCGYDLRASPARCPECGAEPAVQVT